MNFKDIFSKKKELNSLTMPKEETLSYKYQEFLKWYKDNILSKCGSNYGDIETLIKLIDKIAIWYEFKYSNQDIKNIFNGEIIDTTFQDTMSNSALMSHLSKKEHAFFKSPRYISHIKLNNSKIIALSKKGRLCSVNSYSKYNGMYLRDFYLLKGSENDENVVIDAINKYELACKFKQDLMNIIMIRIMLRGNDLYSVYRALMYAKDFDLDLSIPTKYGFGKDLGNMCIINEYLKSGGSTNLEGYYNYFIDHDSVERKTIKDILNKTYRDFTKEEVMLQQKIVQIMQGIVKQNDQETQEDKIKRLRIERGMNRSKSRKV